MVNWWKNESVSAFKEHAVCMVEQYGNYSFAGRNVSFVTISFCYMITEL